MSIENKNNYQLTERGERVKKVTKIVVSALGGAALIIPVVHGIDKAMDGPEFSGSQTVKIGDKDTLWDKSRDLVDGGASVTGDVVEYAMNDPRNAEVAANGTADLGETWVIPQEVVDKN